MAQSDKAPTIRQLTITNFRAIKSLTWKPEPGTNFILGGGDVGKSTILDAIALLLSPSNPSVVPDTDYYRRDETNGFCIEAVIALPDSSSINATNNPKWPWDWDGNKPCIPTIDGDAANVHNDPVFWFQVTGTPDLELLYEVKQPDGSTDSFTVGVRRDIGIVRLSGDDRNDRDLRFVQGSALDRLVADKGLRSRIADNMSDVDLKKMLSADGATALANLDGVFKKRGLPTGLDVAVTGSPGLSVLALVGLTAKTEGIDLPLSTWGSGTRRLSSLAIAEQIQGAVPITLIDEVERGLEPYRQRWLIEKMQGADSQVFATTHSAAAVSVGSKSSLWHLDTNGNVGRLAGPEIDRLRSRDPEAFLSRLTVVGEGATEVGFLTCLLELTLKSSLQQYGIHVADGVGHEATLGLLEALSASGVRFAAFVDNEDNKYPARWAAVQGHLKFRLFRWQAGCLEENIIKLLPFDKLGALIENAEGDGGDRRQTLQLRLGTPKKDLATLQAVGEPAFRQAMIDAALGSVPEGKEEDKKTYKAHAQRWFKTHEGGCELLEKTIALGLWPKLKTNITPFCNAIREAVGLPPVADIAP